MRINGFTLAEVLITLGIIGVVAAITMPTLISNYRESVLKSQYKTALSTISQAHALVVGRLGYAPACHYPEKRIGSICSEYDDEGNCTKFTTNDGEEIPEQADNEHSGCGELYEELQKSLKVIKKCTNAFSEGCIGPSKNGGNYAYEGLDSAQKAKLDNSLTEEEKNYAGNMAAAGCEGFKRESLNSGDALVLANGVIYIPFKSSPTYFFNKVFLLDINGQKAPNQWGQDLFAFEVMGTDSHLRVRPAEACFTLEGTGSKTPTQMQQYAFGK